MNHGAQMLHLLYSIIILHYFYIIGYYSVRLTLNKVSKIFPLGTHLTHLTVRHDK